MKSMLRNVVAAMSIVGASLCIWSVAIANGPDFPIHANGEWRSNGGRSGSWQASLAVSGNTLTGVMSATGEAGLQGAEISGSASGNSVNIVIAQGGKRVATFSGSLNGITPPWHL